MSATAALSLLSTPAENAQAAAPVRVWAGAYAEAGQAGARMAGAASVRRGSLTQVSMATAAEHDGHPVLGFPGILVSDASTGLPHMRPALPPTSICSRADGVVAGQCCVDEPGPQAKCIEVESNRLDLSLKLLVGHTTADHLAQPKRRWKPFDRGEGARAWLYRDLALHGPF